MKKTAWLAAAAAMFTAAPAFAAGGYVGVEHRSSDATLLSEIEFEAVEGEFAVGFGGDAWGAQIDGSFGSIESDVQTNTFAGHLWYQGEGWRVGGVIGQAEIDYYEEEWAYGLEGSFDIGANAVLLGSAVSSTQDEYEVDTLSVDLRGNYYLTPKLRLGAGVGFADVESGGSSDTFETYSLSGEYQPFSAPVSLTLGWMRFDTEGPFQVETISVGARWNFGAATLRDRDNITPFSAFPGYFARFQGLNN